MKVSLFSQTLRLTGLVFPVVDRRQGTRAPLSSVSKTVSVRLRAIRRHFGVVPVMHPAMLAGVARRISSVAVPVSSL